MALAPPPSAVPPTVLLVNPDHRFVEELGGPLRAADRRVLQAPNAEEGLYLCCRHAVDLVVVSRALPGLGGPELCRYLRDHDGPQVIVLTDGDSAEARSRWLDEGATDCIDRAVPLPVVAARVDAVLRRVGTRRHDDGSRRPTGVDA